VNGKGPERRKYTKESDNAYRNNDKLWADLETKKIIEQAKEVLKLQAI